MKSLKLHAAALGAVFVISTIMGLAYTTYWYESRERYISMTRQESLSKIDSLEKQKAEAANDEAAALEEEIRKERETLAAFERTATNTWSQRLICGLLYWWPWIVLTPGIIALCRRFPFKQGFLAPAFAIHLVGGIGFGIAKILIEGTTLQELFGLTPVSKFVGLGAVSLECMTYLIYVAVYNGLAYYRRFREREMRASQLEAQLAKSQLQVLRMQLHPHFLFNTLHAVSTLMARDVESAQRMISRLGDLLRLSLSHIEEQEVPVREELGFLKCYLDIERIRFGDRLELTQEIDAETLDALVPNMILQPIVENAVKHGVSRIAKKGRIRMRTEQRNGTLLIEVRDNGPGLPEEIENVNDHVGLANTRARLDRLYGTRGRIEFERPEGGGLIVRLVIPFHRCVSS